MLKETGLQKSKTVKRMTMKMKIYTMMFVIFVIVGAICCVAIHAL